MKHLYKAALPLLAAAALYSCNKKDGGNTNAGSLNRMEQTLVGKWSIASEINYNYTPGAHDTITYDELSPCDVDNVLVFASDKTYTEEDGAVLCSPTTNGSPFSWKIDMADSTFTFLGGPGIAANYPKILQLDNTTLKTIYRLNGGWGNSQSVIVCIYKRKN